MYEDIFTEELGWQGIKGHAPFHVYQDMNSNTEMPEDFSNGTMAPAVPTSHVNDKDEISDIQISHMLCTIVIQAVRAMDKVKLLDG